jgi:hypothetical protein
MGLSCSVGRCPPVPDPTPRIGRPLNRNVTLNAPGGCHVRVIAGIGLATAVAIVMMKTA